MFRLFQHPSMTIVKGAGLVMKAIIEEGEEEVRTETMSDQFTQTMTTSGWGEDAGACPG